MGGIGILNVGTGDTKLTFDKSNPAEMIRSGRIVTDMLRRGYALLVEVDDGNGGKAYTRVHEFREDTCEYIIADFDPMIAGRPDGASDESNPEPASPPPVGTTGQEGPAIKLKPGVQPGRGKRKIHASTATGVAVSRSAGG